MIEVINLKKSFQGPHGKIEILKSIDLKVNKGEVISILGKSGVGKSTLLSLLCGLELPDSGKIILNSQEFSSLNDSARAALRSDYIGYIFQNYHLVSNLTAIENIEVVLDIQKRKNTKQEAMKWLKYVGLEDRADHFPTTLSGGESQRVAIARALSTRPKIILADEPSGSLDEETGEMINDLLFKIVKEFETSMIIVTHNQDLARRTFKTYQLQHGSLLEL